jgi:hypothetical protein
MGKDKKSEGKRTDIKRILAKRNPQTLSKAIMTRF